MSSSIASQLEEYRRRKAEQHVKAGVSKITMMAVPIEEQRRHSQAIVSLFAILIRFLSEAANAQARNLAAPTIDRTEHVSIVRSLDGSHEAQRMGRVGIAVRVAVWAVLLLVMREAGMLWPFAVVTGFYVIYLFTGE